MVQVPYMRGVESAIDKSSRTKPNIANMVYLGIPKRHKKGYVLWRPLACYPLRIVRGVELRPQRTLKVSLGVWGKLWFKQPVPWAPLNQINGRLVEPLRVTPSLKQGMYFFWPPVCSLLEFVQESCKLERGCKNGAPHSFCQLEGLLVSKSPGC